MLIGVSAPGSTVECDQRITSLRARAVITKELTIVLRSIAPATSDHRRRRHRRQLVYV